MRAAFEIMGSEPWCFTPEETGRLTDWQVWELYVKPHVRRHQAARRGRSGRKGEGGAKKAPARLPTREEFVAQGVETFALPRAHLEKEYDAWAASEEGRAALAAEAKKGGGLGHDTRRRRRRR